MEDSQVSLVKWREYLQFAGLQLDIKVQVKFLADNRYSKSSFNLKKIFFERTKVANVVQRGLMCP